MKGASQVISMALLVGIGLSIAGIYSQWAPNLALNASKETVSQAEQNLKCSNAAIEIKEVTYDKSGPRTIIKLKNTGTINFYGNITVNLINESRVLERSYTDGLNVEEEKRIETTQSEIPERVILTNEECPDLDIEETFIQVE